MRRATALMSPVIAAFAAIGLALAVPAGAGQGVGNPVLQLSRTTLPATGSTTITVSGTDYLVPPHAPGTDVFGGVYMFFGWVRPGGAWGPSVRNSSNNDGTFGNTYSYSGDGGDASTRDDGDGLMRFVAFTAGGVSGDAASTHMDDEGDFSTTLTIPSPRYQYVDPISGGTRTIDCRKVQCGVFTIGAHGKASATNERFTPITFVTSTPTTPTTRPGGGVGPAGTTPVPVPPSAGGPPGSTGATPTTKSRATTTPSSRAPSTAPRSSTTADAGSEGDRRVASTGTEADGKRVALASNASQRNQRSAVVWVIAVGLALAAAAAGGWILFRRARSA